MTVLVTGAGGFLGTAVVERLLAHGYVDIRCNLRRRSGISKLEPLRRQYPQARLSYCVGNLKYREDAVRAVEGVEVIFHLAAGMRGAAADLLMDSVVASRNLLDAVAKRKPMRIVLVSSLSVYEVANLRRGARVNEQTPLERYPEWRDDYSYTKLRQEQLFREYRQRNRFELVVLRPGVIYGPGGNHFSDRVGLTIAGCQLRVRGNNLLPLTFVDNCAEAVVFAGEHKLAAGEAYNVVDDDSPTCREYMCAYESLVRTVRSVPVPYSGMRLFSRSLVKYHKYSQGQLPAILTPYKVACLWGGHRFDNSKLHDIGWKQLVPTSDALQRSFIAFRDALKTAAISRRAETAGPPAGALEQRKSGSAAYPATPLVSQSHPSGRSQSASR
jgi:nucleoside-diphosphate-sugar epimerase